MSLKKIARVDVSCDFPLCKRDYDQTKGKPVAKIYHGCCMAFCKRHSKLLVDAGIELRPIVEVQAELRDLNELPRQERITKARTAREAVFIQELKLS
jgi:hypothetical protein